MWVLNGHPYCVRERGANEVVEFFYNFDLFYYNSLVHNCWYRWHFSCKKNSRAYQFCISEKWQMTVWTCPNKNFYCINYSLNWFCTAPTLKSIWSFYSLSFNCCKTWINRCFPVVVFQLRNFIGGHHGINDDGQVTVLVSLKFTVLVRVE